MFDRDDGTLFSGQCLWADILHTAAFPQEPRLRRRLPGVNVNGAPENMRVIVRLVAMPDGDALVTEKAIVRGTTIVSSCKRAPS